MSEKPGLLGIAVFRGPCVPLTRRSRLEAYHGYPLVEHFSENFTQLNGLEIHQRVEVLGADVVVNEVNVDLRPGLDHEDLARIAV